MCVAQQAPLLGGLGTGRSRRSPGQAEGLVACVLAVRKVVNTANHLQTADLACVELLRRRVSAFVARFRTPVPAVGQQRLALGKPAPGAVEAPHAHLVAAWIVVPEVHRVLDFLLNLRAALAAALPCTGRRGGIVGIRPVRHVVVGPLRYLTAMSARALLIARTSGKLLPFSAVHAYLALCLE